MRKCSYLLVVLSVVLWLVCGMSSFAASPSNEDGLTWTIKDGLLTVVGYGDFESTAISMEGIGNGTQATFLAPKWCEQREKITSAEINIKDITNVESMFLGCSNLKTIKIESFNTKDVISMRNMFAGCSSLETIKVNSLNTKNVIDMSNMFAHCESLTNLDLSSIYLGTNMNVTDMLTGCIGLTSLTIPKGAGTAIMLPEIDGYVWVDTEEAVKTETDTDLIIPMTYTCKKKQKEVEQIVLSKSLLELETGKSEDLTATILPAEAESIITWTTSNKNVVTVVNGRVSAVGAGTAVVTAGAISNHKSAECIVVVTDPVVEEPKEPNGPEEPGIVPFVKLNVTKLPLQKGKTTSVLKIKDKVPENDVVDRWTSSDKKIATIDSKGKIKGIAVGKAVITVTMKSGATASCEVMVQKSKVVTKKLLLNYKKLTMLKGRKEQLVATRNPISATEKITWSSSNKSIATVDKKGKVTVKKAGRVKITAKASNGKKISCTITVKDPTVIFKKKSGAVKVGKTLQITFNSKYLKGDAVKSYKTSSKKVAKVDKNGKIKGVKKGTAKITVTTRKGAKAVFKVTVKK